MGNLGTQGEPDSSQDYLLPSQVTPVHRPPPDWTSLCQATAITSYAETRMLGLCPLGTPAGAHFPTTEDGQERLGLNKAQLGQTSTH